jgi:hypothetical protein
LIRNRLTHDRAAWFRALALLCVLFVGFIGFVQANHVHSDDSRLPSHECSVCAVAHAGVLHQLTYRPLTVFVRTIRVVVAEASPKASEFSSSLYIRPPPAV